MNALRPLLAALGMFCVSPFSAVSQEQRPYSLEKERQLGRQLASEAEQRLKLVDDSILVGYVNGLARRLSEHCPFSLPIELRVVAADQMNASALPGGYLYVNTGLIRDAGSEAEVAGVLAHLIAHLRAGGLRRSGHRAGISDRLDLPLVFMGGWEGYSFGPSGSGLAIPLGFMQAHQRLVIEADEGGLRCLHDAGYNPEGFVQALKKLPAEVARYSTHPSAAERLERAEAILASLEPRASYMADAPGFSEAKQRVEAMQREQPRRSATPPSLRRE